VRSSPRDPEDVGRSLAAIVRGRVLTGAARVARFGRDGSHLFGRPSAVVAPKDREDVVALVGWARRRGVPLVPRGGGTSLDGESVPPDGGVVVDLSGWSRLLEVDTEGLWARVEPGIVNYDLQRSLQPHGLFFPPNPGSWTTSTVGGNVGTNASGMRSFRYGPTRAWVRELTAVLGTGETVHLGTRAAKRSVGPDLLQLFIGSEGTLGVASEVTVRLAPLPSVRHGVVVPLSPGVALGPLVARLARLSDAGLSAVEFLDTGSADALSEQPGADWPGGTPLLLLEVEAASAREAARRIHQLGPALGAVGTRPAVTTFEDSDELWTLRGKSGDVLLARYGYHVREDVAVPLGRIDELVAELAGIALREKVPYFLFGHLGEGSLHPNYVVDPTGPVAERIRGAVLRAAHALGGTISAEHGIGRLKRPYLTEELGGAAVALLWAVKRACDPDGILNPGKLYPERPPRARSPSRSLSGSAAARVPTGSPTSVGRRRRPRPGPRPGPGTRGARR